MALARRVAPGLEVVGHRQSSGNMGAHAVAIETDAVIAALNGVAENLAAGERCKPVRTTVRQDPDFAVLAPEDHYGLIADYARNRFGAGKLEAVGGDVPVVAQIIGTAHGVLPNVFVGEYTPGPESFKDAAMRSEANVKKWRGARRSITFGTSFKFEFPLRTRRNCCRNFGSAAVGRVGGRNRIGRISKC
jgi:hypothetical protein